MKARETREIMTIRRHGYTQCYCRAESSTNSSDRKHTKSSKMYTPSWITLELDWMLINVYTNDIHM